MRTRHFVPCDGLALVGLQTGRNHPQWLISEEKAHTLLAVSFERGSHEGRNEA